MKRRYGLTMVMRGKIFSASLVCTLGWTITSSPGSLNPRSKQTIHMMLLPGILPIDWSCDLVLVASLERVDDPQNFGSVATSARRV